MSEFHGVIWTVDIIYEGITSKYMKDYFFFGEKVSGSNWQWELKSQPVWQSLDKKSRIMAEVEWDSEAKNLGKNKIEKQKMVGSCWGPAPAGSKGTLRMDCIS